MDLGEDLISCLCLEVKSRALVLNAMAKNLDALNVWWLVFGFHMTAELFRQGGIHHIGQHGGLQSCSCLLYTSFPVHGSGDEITDTSIVFD